MEKEKRKNLAFSRILQKWPEIQTEGIGSGKNKEAQIQMQFRI